MRPIHTLVVELDSSLNKLHPMRNTKYHLTLQTGQVPAGFLHSQSIA